LFGAISVPDAVAAEILRGKDLSDGFASAMDVEDGIDAGWIKVEEPDACERDVSERYSHDPGIHPGEAAVLAMGRRFDLLLLDDLCARTFAKALGFDMVGTIGIILQAYDAVHEWIRQSGHQITESPREIYLAPEEEVSEHEPFIEIAWPF